MTLRSIAPLAALALLALAPASAGQASVPYVEMVRPAETPEEVSTVIEIVVLLTVLSLCPAFLVLMTAFTRIVIVLSFVSRALSTQNLPPSQVVVGLSLILTFLVMQPTFVQMKDDALIPYMDEEITQKEMFLRAEVPMRNFMFKHTRKEDVKLFIDLTEFDPGKPKGEVTRGDIPTYILVPAFVISELTRAFEMGFALFLPFVVIDMVVAATLISMGMLVLPPILISLPFKILLFVLVDGWRLIVGSVIQSFY